jgi:hypothetical protein
VDEDGTGIDDAQLTGELQMGGDAALHFLLHLGIHGTEDFTPAARLHQAPAQMRRRVRRRTGRSQREAAG